ncbi:MAG: hypothetical protein VZR54_01930 [Ruminococcus sp.]|nr:hypothetical protein [Ruminococcus sp.]
MKRYFWKILPVFLCVLIIVSAIPFSVNAAATVITVDTAQELTDACAQINTNGGEYVISLNKDISGAVSVDITKSDAVVTIIGNGHTITSTGNTVYVSNGATVNLGDGTSTLTLKSANNNDTSGIIYVLDNGTCNMYDKVTVKDHKGNNYLGGGVTVQGATFHMYGGTIDNCGIEGGSVCYGGGVAVINGGIFIMDGGTISNCYAFSDYSYSGDTRQTTATGGGVFVTGGSTFTMNDGTITGCEATNFGGGVALQISNMEWNAKGIANPQSTVTINGGTISGNTAIGGAGIFASGYFYAYANEFHWEPLGIGVTDHPGLFVNSGEISGNNADDAGGGVFIAMLKPAQTVQLHNAVIKNNTADNGAGVENFGFWTQMDIDGCTITGNAAATNGGGILASTNSSGGYTTIKNTTIKENTSGDRGAGVYYDADSEIRISGADVIQDNTYNGKLNNLNVLSLNKPVKVVGDLTGSQIGLSDPTLWDDNKTDVDSTAVSTEYLTNGYRTYNPDEHPSEYFTSDHESWYVDRSQITTATVSDPNSKAYREYTVRRYAYIPPSDPKLNALFGQKNQYVYSEIQNPDIENINSFTDFYNEMKYRYSDTSRFEKTRDINSNGNIYLQYTVLDADYPTTLTIQKSSNNSYASVKFSQSALTGKGGTIEYDLYLSDQTSYANPKELVYIINNKDTEPASNYSFSEEYTTTKTIKYVNANPPADTIYEYDDYGNLTAKLEIVGGVSSYETKQLTTTTTTGNENEVRLVRRTTPIKFHVNNPNSADDELFRVYNPESGKTYTTENGVYDLTNYQVHEFYDIPAFAEDDYVFAGWYTTENNNNNSSDNAFEFDSAIPAGVTDVYAHWIPVGEVDQDEEDDKILPNNANTYKGFDLFGVQIRRPYKFDNNQGDYMPEGLRFVTSISEDLLSDIDSLSDKTVNGNKVEYGYVTAGESTVSKVVEAFQGVIPSNYKLQYKGENVNGIDTTVKGVNENNFNYITNLDCTSTQGGYGSNSRIKTDHKNFGDYRLATFVITYEDDASGENKGKNIAARAYLRYYDVNGLLRTFYNDYAGTDFYGGCSTCYNAVAQ